VKRIASEPGLVLVDGSLNLIASNVEAIRIFAFPERVEEIRQLDLWLAGKIRTRLVDRQARSRTVFVKEFTSARRPSSRRGVDAGKKIQWRVKHRNPLGTIRLDAA
jgi:hypothetical protein